MMLLVLLSHLLMSYIRLTVVLHELLQADIEELLIFTMVDEALHGDQVLVLTTFGVKYVRLVITLQCRL